MAEVTPDQVIAQLSHLANELQLQAARVEEMDLDFITKRAQAKRTYAEAFLRADGAMDMKRYQAELIASDATWQMELAEQVLRAAKEQMRVIRDRIDVGRSMNAIIRMEWAAS